MHSTYSHLDCISATVPKLAETSIFCTMSLFATFDVPRSVIFWSCKFSAPVLLAFRGTPAAVRHHCYCILHYFLSKTLHLHISTALHRIIAFTTSLRAAEQAMGRWVMGQCMLTHVPPLFHQPSKSQ